jgi:hypothetical protein
MGIITVSNTNQNTKLETAATAKTGLRAGYIDMVRLIMTILVVAVHAAVTYGSIGDWTYEDPAQSELSSIVLSFVVFYSQAFFMALFFFFTGYFTPGSVDRKGWIGFWKDRILRIGIPLVAYTWFLSRLPNFIDAIANGGYTGTFWQFSAQTMFTDPDEGPTWFLFTILVFSAVYFLIRLLGKKLGVSSEWVKKVPAPGNLALVTAAAFISLGTLLIAQFMQIPDAVDVFDIFSLKVGFFPSYIVFFIAGILAYRNHWLDQLSAKVQRFWNWVTLTMVVSLPALLFLGGAPDGYIELFMGGLNWRCFLMSVWLGFSCVAFSISITLWLRDRTSANSKVAAIGVKDNYAFYVFHPLILVPVCYALSFTGLDPMIKFAISLVITVVLCYLAAEVLRRIPGLKRIL